MNARQARLGIHIFTALVVASVGVTLAGLTWRLAGNSGESPAAVAAPVSAGGATDIAPMLAMAPFGTVLASGDQHGDGPLKVKAIFMAIPADASSVLIAGSDGKVASYAVGSAVGGGVIDQIQPDQILWRGASGVQAIGFPSSGSAPGGTAKAGPGVAVAVQTVSPGKDMGPGGGHAGPGPGQAQIPSGSPLDAYPSGYRVDGAAPPALFAAGLKPGDVVEQINGAPVGGGANARDLLAHAMQAGSAQVVVSRAGQTIALNLAVH